MSPTWKATIYVVLATALATYGEEVAAGRAPLPTDWRWLAPILVAVIAVLAVRLKMEAGVPMQDAPPPAPDYVEPPTAPSR